MEYPGPKEADPPIGVLDGIDLTIQDGEFVSIVGPSGCGKSTFLAIVDGLVKATSGQLLLDGVQIQEPGPERAMVFQDSSLLPWRTVFRNVTYGLECRNGLDESARRRVDALVKTVGLEDFAHHYPHQLSGGMQQRVNLARALALDPEILLMDEPFAALDAQTREIMQEGLLRIWEEFRKTLLFVTHQIEEAVFLSDRVVVFTGRPARVKAEVDIPLGRPRPFSLKRTRSFHDQVDTLWAMIEPDVRRGLQSEHV